MCFWKRYLEMLTKLVKHLWNVSKICALFVYLLYVLYVYVLCKVYVYSDTPSCWCFDWCTFVCYFLLVLFFIAFYRFFMQKYPVKCLWWSKFSMFFAHWSVDGELNDSWNCSCRPATLLKRDSNTGVFLWIFRNFPRLLL